MTTENRRTKTPRLPRAIRLAIATAHDKKALQVTLLDLRRSSAFTDYFVICSGQTSRQVKAIADAIEETLRALPLRPSHTEGSGRSEWILLDYFDFVVHVFTPPTRAFYGLERLWGSAERVDMPDGDGPRA